MNLHEYQSKRVFAQFGIPVPQGEVATTPAEVRDIAVRLGTPVVVKSQVLVGGRGKAGGIKLEPLTKPEKHIPMPGRKFIPDQIAFPGCELVKSREDNSPQIVLMNTGDNVVGQRRQNIGAGEQPQMKASIKAVERRRSQHDGSGFSKEALRPQARRCKWRIGTDIGTIRNKSGL